MCNMVCCTGYYRGRFTTTHTSLMRLTQHNPSRCSRPLATLDLQVPISLRMNKSQSNTSCCEFVRAVARRTARHSSTRRGRREQWPRHKAISQALLRMPHRWPPSIRKAMAPYLKSPKSKCDNCRRWNRDKAAHLINVCPPASLFALLFSTGVCCQVIAIGCDPDRHPWEFTPQWTNSHGCQTAMTCPTIPPHSCLPLQPYA